MIALPLLAGLGWWYFHQRQLPTFDPAYREYAYITNGKSNTVSVIRNINTGPILSAASFASRVDFTVGNTPRGVAVADLDGDGVDELVSLYPVCFWVADGRTGRLTRGVELASRKKLPAWAAYGEPIITQLADKTAAVLLDSQYILALLDANGAPIPGLYAAGNDMASIMGGNYPGAGITLGPALTFGYIAGRHIASGDPH